MASPNVSFGAIPSSIRKPGRYFEFNTELAVRTLPGNLQKTLIIGQRLASGSVLANTPMLVFSDAEAANYFGNGSVAHLMVRAALIANPYLALTVLAVDDAVASIAATGTLTLAGTATSSGVLTVKIAAQQVQVAITTGDTAAVVAAALNLAINRILLLPVSSSATGAVVTLTAKNKGTLGNAVKVSAAVTALGVTATATTMTGGATDPTLTAAFAAVFSAGHNIIICPYADTSSLTALRTHLDTVGGPLEQRGAIGVYAHVGSLAQATTLATSINSGMISGILVPNAFDMNYEVAAAYGAVIASEEDPARPLNTLELKGITAPPLSNWLGRTEQENALYNGVTPTEVGPGNKVQIVRAITTYTLNPLGVPDISLLDLTTIRTLFYVRLAVRERISLRFPRSKLSSRTSKAVRSEVLDVLFKLEELEIIENVEANKSALIVERDSQDPNRLNAAIPSDVVNGLHIFAGRIDLLL